jgi:hypothetical protein
LRRGLLHYDTIKAKRERICSLQQSSLPKRLAHFRVQVEPAGQIVPVESAKHC